MLTREILLQAIQATQPNCYGVTLRDELQRRLGYFVSLGTIYTEVDKLEGAGLVHTHETPGGPERGHRAKLMIELVNNHDSNG